MPSKTSCFKTLLRSDWHHYWPLCFIYTVVWMVAQPIALWQQTNWESELPMIRRVGSFMANHVATGWICALFAILTAMAVWSFLMRSSSVQFMHGLPATRFTQFTAHFIAGFSMLTAGHILTFFAILGIMALRGAVVFSAALLWLAVAELTALFFFGFAAVSCIITGWLLAAPVFYGGLNCVFIAAASLIQELMAQCDYWGFTRGRFPRFVFWLTPLYQMSADYSADYQCLDTYEYGLYVPNARTLPTAAIYGAVGLVLAGCAYLLYRKRPSETAGDAVSFRWLRPIVKWVISLCGGMAFGLFVVSLFLGETNVVLSTVFICIFGVICYIAVEMLLHKSFRVFRRSTFVGCGILCAGMIALSALFAADVFGYRTYLPEAETVAEVRIYGSSVNETVFIDRPEDIQKVLAIHRELIGENAAVYQEVPEDTLDTSYLDINYVMKDDSGVSRSYYFYVPRDGALHRLLNDFYNNPSVREKTVFPDYEEGRENSISGGIINLYDYSIHDDQGYTLNRQFEMNEAQAQELYCTLGQEAHEQGQRDILNSGQLECEFNFEVYDEYGYFIYNTVNLDECPRTFQLLVDFGFVEAQE